MSDHREASPPSLLGRIKPAPDRNIDPIDSARASSLPVVGQDEGKTAESVKLPFAPVQPVEPEGFLNIPAEAAPTIAPSRVVAVGAPIAQASATVPRRTKRPEVTFQLGVRVDGPTRDLLSELAERHEVTFRTVVERALRIYADLEANGSPEL